MNYVADDDILSQVLAFASENLGEQGEALEYSLWRKRMHAHPKLLPYAVAEGRIAGVALAFLEENGNVTIGAVAVDEKYRGRGVGKALLLAVEREAAALGSHLIALGSVDEAQGFYEKCGYTGQLLIQSEEHTVEELAAQNPGCPIVFTNVYDGTISQLCLKLTLPQEELCRPYQVLGGCDTQVLFWKGI